VSQHQAEIITGSSSNQARMLSKQGLDSQFDPLKEIEQELFLQEVARTIMRVWILL